MTGLADRMADKEYGISYWDSLIVAAAERSGSIRIVSENLNSRQSYYGIAVIDPSRPSRG